jgi:multisubunit Na+/H+ antiporter MnhB subunit
MISRIAALVAVAALIPGALWIGGMDQTLLAPMVRASLPATGLESAVTGVLLDFRAFDTLLEVTVLAAAAFGAFNLPAPRPPPQEVFHFSTLPTWLIPRLAPLIGLLVIYLWWAGSSRPGGAFQAGAALTGVLLLLYFIERVGETLPHARTGLRLALAGPLLFLAAGLIPLAAGGAFLDHPEGWTKPLILAVEAALTVSIGGALALLATGGGEVQ